MTSEPLSATQEQPAQGKRWVLAPQPPRAVSDALIAYPPVIRQLLALRGVTTAARAELYFQPDERLQGPPELLPDMEPAVGRLYRALLSGERIAVYGDFDVDGVTATALLAEALRGLGANDVIPYIPHRVDEGHGINAAALRYLAAEGATLVVTGDCGITGLTDGRNASIPRGLDVIITDHHLPKEGGLPPVVAAIDPMRRDSSYPWPELAGVGVAFKLVQALYQALGRTWDERLLELVALGTVADVAPLTGENRYLVKEGVRQLRRTQRVGLRTLAQKAGYDSASLDEESIAYGLGPRLNAAGRLAHADLSLRLLLTQDEGEANELATTLDSLNARRQQLTADAVERARAHVLAAGRLEPLIMVGDPSFPPGIVGLAASKLAEEFYRPALVFVQGAQEIKGSARSIPEFDVTDALARCAALLTRFGGHHQAAGFAAPIAHLERLRDQLVSLAGEMLDGVDLRPALSLDAEAQPSSLPGPAWDLVQKMSPFGAGNPRPLFLGRNLEVVGSRTVGGTGAHLKLRLKERHPMGGVVTWDAIAFRLGDRLEEAQGLIDVAFRPRPANGYGRSALELEVVDFRLAEGGKGPP
jgi:single-stranded-DNA-specific exonuclease